jgi:hypothetical protein
MRLVVLLLAACLAGCNFVYKIDVQQGNYVTQDVVQKLKPGMTKLEVRTLLGTPAPRRPVPRQPLGLLLQQREARAGRGPDPVLGAFRKRPPGALRWRGAARGSAPGERACGRGGRAGQGCEPGTSGVPTRHPPERAAEMSTVRVAIAGASGRMGRALLEAATSTPGVKLGGALDVAASPCAGRDAGELCAQARGVMVATDVAAALQAADVLVDFTRPEGTLGHVLACRKAKRGSSSAPPASRRRGSPRSARPRATSPS